MRVERIRRLFAFFLILSLGLGFIKTTIYADGKLTSVSGNTISMSKIGNERDKQEIDDGEDDTPPYVVSLSRSASDNYFVNDRALSIHYRILADDDRQLDELPYSYDGGKTWTKSNEFIVTKNGTVTILIKDKAGNMSEYEFEEYRIDNKPPYISNITYCFTEECNGYGKSVEVVVDAIDEGGAGLAPQYIAFFEDAYSSKNSRSVNVNGEYTIWLKDALGNVAKESISINNIDINGPVINDVYALMSVSENGYYQDAKLCIDAYDTEAGLHREAFSYDGGATFEQYNQKVVYENGTYHIVVRDAFDHYSYGRIEVSGIDDKSPVIDEALLELNNENNGYGSDGVLTIKAHDEESGLSIMPYSFDGGKCYGSNNTYKVLGNEIVNVCVMDKAGNISASSVNITQIDSALPYLMISGNPTVNTREDVTLKINASDMQSGIAGIWYENTSNHKKVCLLESDGEKNVSDSLDISKNGTYIVYAKDVAGNEAKQTIKVTKIDKTTKSSSSTSTGIKREVISRGKNTTTTNITSGKIEERLTDPVTKSSTVIKKSISFDEETTDAGLDDNEVVIEPEFVPTEVSLVTKDDNKDIENVDEETIVSETEDKLSKGNKAELNIVYPENKEKGGRETVIIVAVFVSLFLLSLLCFVLYKMGLLSKDKLEKQFRKGKK